MQDLTIIEPLVKRALERNATVGNHLLDGEGGQAETRLKEVSGSLAAPFRHRQD